MIKIKRSTVIFWFNWIVINTENTCYLFVFYVHYFIYILILIFSHVEILITWRRIWQAHHRNKNKIKPNFLAHTKYFPDQDDIQIKHQYIAKAV